MQYRLQYIGLLVYLLCIDNFMLLITAALCGKQFMRDGLTSENVNFIAVSLIYAYHNMISV